MLKRFYPVKKREKVHDQEVGAILDFNPSDCSHWKRGEKNIRSVFALSRLADALKVDTALLYDIASGLLSLDEAYYEYKEVQSIRSILNETRKHEEDPDFKEYVGRVMKFVEDIHTKAEYKTPPFYLPEIFNFFSFVTLQPVEMIENLSRVLRTKPGQYIIQFKKSELMSQTRMSIVENLGKILLEVERERFPELGAYDSRFAKNEGLTFVTNMLVPKELLRRELIKVDTRQNLILELSSLFWAPMVLVRYQLQNLIEDPMVSNVLKSREDRFSSSRREI